MDVREAYPLIAKIRDHYAQRLVAEFSRLRFEYTGRIFTEPAQLNADGELVREGPSKIGCRVDVILPEEGQLITIDSSSVLEWPPISLQRGTTQVSLNPFQWDWCVITLHGTATSFDWQAILDWFEQWLDEEDTRDPDDQGLFGVVHFLSDPAFTETTVSFTTDLGSSPPAAFIGLLDACALSQPSKIYVSNTAKPVAA